VLFLRKRDPNQAFWAFAAQPERTDVPAALRELVRDIQVVIGRDEAEEALEYLRQVGFQEETPVELVDSDGKPAVL
jgi:hypothetical protein